MYDLLKKLTLSILTVFSGMLLIAAAAFIGGTFIWLIWPYIFPVIFPKAVASGILIAKIPWWTAVFSTWFINILIGNKKLSFK